MRQPLAGLDLQLGIPGHLHGQMIILGGIPQMPPLHQCLGLIQVFTGQVVTADPDLVMQQAFEFSVLGLLQGALEGHFGRSPAASFDQALGLTGQLLWRGAGEELPQ